MTYIRQWALMIDPDFAGRVAMASLQAARQVLNEPLGQPNHEERIRFARAIIGNPVSYAHWFLPDIASNTTIAAAGPVASADGDLDFVIASVFDELANRVFLPEQGL